MSSSTFNSEKSSTHPETGKKPWTILMLLSLLLAISALSVWEFRVRSLGYAPTYMDNPNLWAKHRSMAHGAGPEQIVFLGASRTLFDIDLEVFQQATGGPQAIQLAMVGSNPLPVLRHLADDPSYSGTTIVGIVPSMIYASKDRPFFSSTKILDYYKTWSPAQQLELPLSLKLQGKLAIANKYLSLPALLQ